VSTKSGCENGHVAVENGHVAVAVAIVVARSSAYVSAGSVPVQSRKVQCGSPRPAPNGQAADPPAFTHDDPHAHKRSKLGLTIVMADIVPLQNGVGGGNRVLSAPKPGRNQAETRRKTGGVSGNEAQNWCKLRGNKSKNQAGTE
jgi:hypothetical protein